MIENIAIERALIAVGLRGISVIVATDGQWISRYWDGAEQIRLPHKAGLYLWTGRARVPAHAPGETAHIEWDGATREVEPQELAELLKMEPPDT